MKPKAIILDWDDTLAHTRKAVVEAMEYVLKAYNKDSWDITKAKFRDTKKSLKENFANFFGKQANAAYNLYIDYYKINSYNQVQRVEKAFDFLSMCQQRNIHLFIVSNKEKSLLIKEVDFCFPNIKFSRILGNGDARQNKPAPDPVFEALKESHFEINRENVWLVGDTKQDTECAYNADVLPILIGNGKFMEDDYIKEKLNSTKPLLVFNNFQDLIDYLS